MTVAEMFLHIHGTRHFVLSEDAPEFALAPLEKGWRETRDVDRIAQMLNDSARAVRAALKDIKNLHRNPLIHPEHTLESVDEAIESLLARPLKAEE